MTKFNGVIENKLRLLEKKIDEIKSWKVKSLNDIKNSSILNNALERALQVAVEIMIDISERILAIRKIPPQNSAAENMKRLEDLKILKDATRYMDMARFRNFIVHRYEYIDIDILFDITANKLGYFQDFIKEIRNFED